MGKFTVTSGLSARISDINSKCDEPVANEGTSVKLYFTKVDSVFCKTDGVLAGKHTYSKIPARAKIIVFSVKLIDKIPYLGIKTIPKLKTINSVTSDYQGFENLDGLKQAVKACL